MSLAWRSGLLPAHRPAWCDLEWLADPAWRPWAMLRGAALLAARWRT